MLGEPVGRNRREWRQGDESVAGYKYHLRLGQTLLS